MRASKLTPGSMISLLKEGIEIIIAVEKYDFDYANKTISCVALVVLSSVTMQVTRVQFNAATHVATYDVV